MEIIDLRVRKVGKNLIEEQFNPKNLEKHGLTKIILLPDFSTGKSYLPVGTVSFFDKELHTPSPQFLGRDVGCGMSLYETLLDISDINLQTIVDKTDLELMKYSELEFTLGSHFIDFCRDKNGLLFFIIHAGFKKYGSYIVENSYTGEKYVQEAEKNIKFASSNRNHIAEVIYEVLGIDKLPPILDKPHNTIESSKEGYLYRKGASKLLPGELSLLPSNLLHPIFIIKGKSKIKYLDYSFSHGTLRKEHNGNLGKISINSQDLRDKIKMPKKLTDEELEILLPTEYDDFLSYAYLFSEFISIENKFEIIGYLGLKHT